MLAAPVLRSLGTHSRLFAGKMITRYQLQVQHGSSIMSARLVHTQADQGSVASCADAASDVPKQTSTPDQPEATPAPQQHPRVAQRGPVLRRRTRLPPHPYLARKTQTPKEPVAPDPAAQPAAVQPGVPVNTQAAPAASQGRRRCRQTSGDAAASGSNRVMASPPCHPSTPDMQQHPTDRNHAAAVAALQAAAAAGQPPQLKSLLVEPSWLQVLGCEFDQPYMHHLQQFLQQQWASEVVYPPAASIFRAFNAVPLDKVRVVILGQDPYHGQGQAMGLSFSVPPGVKVPSSLVNIYKELQDDVGANKPNHGCLQKWCDQGVLLLNAVLTVHEAQADSHAGRGWERFTSAALEALTRQRSDVVFLLWGQKAQARCQHLNINRRYKLSAPHPSGLSAHRGFFGCRHFSAANDLLVQAGHAPIDWQIDDM